MPPAQKERPGVKPLQKGQELPSRAQEVQVLLGAARPAVEGHQAGHPVGPPVGKAQGAEVGELLLPKLAPRPGQGNLAQALGDGMVHGVGHPQVPGPGDGGEALLHEAAHHLPRVGPVAHHVPQDQDLVHPLGPQGLQGGLEGGQVGVDIGKDPEAHGTILP
ncbi:hypothetical protein TJA_07930 [Thermus sp. LT1-2-5]